MSGVALLVDHPQRDLDGLTLLAARLCAKGIISYLVPSRLARTELPGLAPDVAVLNHIKHTDASLVKMLQEIGVGVAVLDTEGGVLENVDVYRQSLAEESIRAAVGRFFSWGPKLAKRALDEAWFTAKQTVVSGHPRFDYYHLPWRNAVLARIPSASDKPRPMILVVGSFTLANPRFLPVEREVDLLISQARQDSVAVRRRLENERKGIVDLTALANTLAQALPAARVVYRPHPFERAETYRDLLSQRVELNDGGAAIDWILQASAVVQRGSTLAVEAAFGGIPVFSPEWLNDWSRAEWIGCLNTVCRNADEMLDRLKDAISGGSRPAHRRLEVDELLHNWFFSPDGCANERVADGIIDLLGKGKGANRRRARALFSGYRDPGQTLGRKIVNGIRFTVSVPADFSFRRMARRNAAWPWDDGSRTFTVDEVKRNLYALFACGFHPGFAAEVAASRDRGDYVVPNRLGRSVTIAPRIGNSS